MTTWTGRISLKPSPRRAKRPALRCTRGHHSGELRRETAEAKAERIIAEELRRLGWSQADLDRRRKNDPAKLALAARLRQETILSLKWVAARLQMGTWKSANARLHRWMQEKK